ncbi:M56 family metallopeptidase [uncultured Maribacter sp.]|uniref:M56 family metallopeptidase n=1 Tax=uncultured Maribacter sp. TaxID=431308 RepID=UPI0030EC2257
MSNANDTVSILSDPSSINELNPFPILIIVYIIGALFLLFRLFKQGFDLKKVLNNGNRIEYSRTAHIKTKDTIQPFSFFKSIVYNPSLHSEKELEAILAHEEVHAKQFHSLDILLMEIFLILQWFNPFAWFYQIAIKQNLEFLADTENHQIKKNKKAYQYILLQQAFGNQQLSIVNPFFNSLIKKRIVMINQQKSHRLKALKSLIVLPLLALFLLSFNVKEVYTLQVKDQYGTAQNIIEFLIDKNTSDAQLIKIKSELAKEKFDFSYTTVRNNDGEIKNISLHISGGNKKNSEVSSRFNSASDNDTIDPTLISIDLSNNKITIRTADSSNKMLKVETDNNKQVNINTTPKSEHDIEIVEEEGNTFLFSDYTKDPLFFINGKKSNETDIKNLDKKNIESMNVLKGEFAIMKYGKDAVNGVIEIITKEK